MATFDIAPLFRSAVGFDRVFDQLQSALRDGDAGPAYDILKTGDEDYRITLAVPGYRSEDLTIESRDGALWISGRRQGDPDHNQYLHRGIGLDSFQRRFQLAEHVEVTGARMQNGLLEVELVRKLPEAMRPRRIEIRVDQRNPAVARIEQPGADPDRDTTEAA